MSSNSEVIQSGRGGSDRSGGSRANAGSFELIAALVESAVAAVITIDSNGLIEHTNPATEKLFGYRASELIGQNVSMLMPQPYRREHGRHIERYLKSGERKVIGIGREVVACRRDGSVFPAHLAISEFKVGERRYFAGYLHDLSAAKKALAAATQLGCAVEDSISEIYLFDARTLELTNANRGARTNLRYDQDEIRRLSLFDLSEDYKSTDRRAAIASLQSGDIERLTLETSHRRKDGSVYPAEVHLQLSNAGDPPVIIAHVRDLTQDRHREQLNLLNSELRHRTRNLLAVIQAIATQTKSLASSLEDFDSKFSARLRALGTTFDLLGEENWRGAFVGEIVRAHLAHYENQFGSQIEIDGPKVFLKAEAAQNIGLALHELSTNAAKYGALSVPNGRVTIRWALESGPSESGFFQIDWIERNGPLVTTPDRSGFGHQVIDGLVRGSLNGKVALGYQPEGFSWKLRIPASYVQSKDAVLDPALRLPSR
jgi:PAS domain S-box-containing protein